MLSLFPLPNYQNMFKKISLTTAVLEIFVCSIIMAQPSGGPYGPVNQFYSVPEASTGIYYVAPDGDVNVTGIDQDKPTTLEQAFKKVVSGDYIVLKGGVYRTGNLVLNQRITMQPFENEKPVLKGTYVAGEWRRLR